MMALHYSESTSKTTKSNQFKKEPIQCKNQRHRLIQEEPKYRSCQLQQIKSPSRRPKDHKASSK